MTIYTRNISNKKNFKFLLKKLVESVIKESYSAEEANNKLLQLNGTKIPLTLAMEFFSDGGEQRLNDVWQNADDPILMDRFIYNRFTDYYYKIKPFSRGAFKEDREDNTIDLYDELNHVLGNLEYGFRFDADEPDRMIYAVNSFLDDSKFDEFFKLPRPQNIDDIKKYIDIVENKFKEIESKLVSKIRQQIPYLKLSDFEK